MKKTQIQKWDVKGMKQSGIWYNITDLKRWSDYYGFETAGENESYVALYRRDKLFGLGPLDNDDMERSFSLFRNWGFKPIRLSEKTARRVFLVWIKDRETTNEGQTKCEVNEYFATDAAGR